jgi:RHS repeat-associated protein
MLDGIPADQVYWLGSLAQGNEDASGTIYMRNRYYNPQTGAFTQQDPIGLAGGLNTYGFAEGDPVSYSDPYGLKADSVYVVGNAEYRSRVISSILHMSAHSTTFRQAFKAIEGSSTHHIWITQEGATLCPRSCTNQDGENGQRITHPLTSSDYFSDYTPGAWSRGDALVLSHEISHAVARLLSPSLTGVSRACGSRSRTVSEDCATGFEGRVMSELGWNTYRNPELSMPPVPQ